MRTDGPAAQRAAAQRSADWIRDIYGAHSGEMYGYAIRALRDAYQAEDAVQEAFVRAWRASARFDPDRGGVRAWLFAILRNVVIDAAAAARARPALPGELPGAERTPSEVDVALDGWVVEEALRRIREEHRAVLVETYYRGRPYAEVAADLGIPVATARTRAFYGLRALRVALLEMGWES
jgi:RNA polymerase sigma-70 factor (ECF subfamily)